MDAPTEKFSAVSEAAEIMAVRNAQYKDSNVLTAAVLKILPYHHHDECDPEQMAILSAAIVKLAQFVRSKLTAQDKLIEFAGFMELFSGHAIAGSLRVAPANHFPSAVPIVDRSAVLSVILQNNADRSSLYGPVYRSVGELIRVFFPRGAVVATREDTFFLHNFELLLVKLVRFCYSGFRHADSLCDMMAYVSICVTSCLQTSIGFRSGTASGDDLKERDE